MISTPLISWPKPFKLDIDELVDEFNEGNHTTLADMKKMWMAKKFSYIYEAKPISNEAIFMQSLYSYSISHMVSIGAPSRRLGGLYCLYCLYETQPYKPAFKIYLSLCELKRLKILVIDAKKIVDRVDGYESQRVDEIMKLENKRIQIAYDKLLGNTLIEDYLHMDLGTELELSTLKKMSKEYAAAKELAISEAMGTVDIKDVKHIAEEKKLVGDMVDDIVKDWNAQKESFCQQTGINTRNDVMAVDEFYELEHLLNE
ncbi:hypothetical protein OPV22_004004 [Ensete ventricosum]|uniref:Uncharacterized protein n=1 Tax=Ensete ventricosum TaxID=4639 RepID=A0AAV8S282_ENSVE|nr:hypothetical protein OPV22_004004 [Ensete ventricosum]